MGTLKKKIVQVKFVAKYQVIYLNDDLGDPGLKYSVSCFIQYNDGRIFQEN